MPQYQIEIPGQGKFQIDSPTELTDDQVYAAVQAQLGSAPAPKTGLGAALGKGTESMVSQTRSGIAGLLGSPEEAAIAGLERGKGISAEYADQIGFDKVKEAYAKGLLPAAGEVVRQVPLALAEQFPNLAAMAGTARAGAMLGARMGPYGAIAGGLAGALAPSALQQFGGNIERQAAEQQEAGAPVSVDRGAALAAAAPQAALDVAGTYIPLGGRLVGKLVGIPEQALLKDTTGKVAKLAEERLLATLAKGTATGVLAEVPTEIAQQMLERAQAGMPLTDADALKEYGETAYQTALLGPLGAAGRLSERSGARLDIEKQKQEERRQAQIAEAEQEQQLAQQKQVAEAATADYRQTPKFAQEADAKYVALQQQVASLKETANAKVDPTDLAGVAAKKEARQKLKDLMASAEYKQTIADWRETAPIRAQRQTERDAAEAAQAAQKEQADQARYQQTELAAQQGQETQQQPFYQSPQATLPGMEAVEPPAPAEPAPSPDDAQQFAQKQRELEQLRQANTDAQSAAAARGDTAAWEKASRDGALLDNEYAYVTKQLDLLGGYAAPASDAAAIEKQLNKVKAELQANSGPGYDAKLAAKQVTKIKDLTAKLAEYGGVQTSFGFGEKGGIPATKEQTSESKPSFGARVYKPGAEDIEAQEQAYQEDLFEQESQAAKDTERERALAPEKNALARMASKTDQVTTEGKTQISTLADKLAEALRTPLKGISPGRVQIGEGKTLSMSGVDEIRAQIAYARATNNRGLVSELTKVLDELTKGKAEIPGSALEEGLTAKEAGVEANLGPSAKKANIATRFAQQQLGAFERLVRLIDGIRTQAQGAGVNLDAAKQEMAKHRQVIVGAALNEIEARRAAAGLPPLGVDEQFALIPKIEAPLNELINRGAKDLEALTSRKAQMRGNKIVLSAEEAQRPPKGQRVLGKGRTDIDQPAAVLAEQMRNVIEEGYGIPEEVRQPLGPKRGVRPLLRPTPPGELALPQEEIFRRAEESKTASKEDKALLSRAIDAFDKLGAYTQALVIEQAKRITNDMPIDATMELKTALAMQEVANASNLEQRDLFEADPDYKFERATATNFQKALNSQAVAKLRKDVAEVKYQEEFMAKRQATIDAKVKEAEDLLAKMEEGKAKTPVEAARRTLARVQATAQEKVAASKQEELLRFMQQKVPLANLVDAVIKQEKLHKKAEAHFNTVLQNVSDIFLAFHIAQNELSAGRSPKTNQKALTELSVFLPQARAILERASNRLDDNTKKLAKANEAVERLRAANKAKNEADVVGRTVLEAGEKAGVALEKARQDLAEAEATEKSARRGLELIQAEATRKPKEPGPLDAIETRVVGKTTVFRDTSAPAVQQEVRKQRTALALQEGLYEKAKTAYNDAIIDGDADAMAQAEASMRSAESAMQKASEAMGEALNNAPLVKVSDEDRRAQAQYAEHEAAMGRLIQADMARLYQEAGMTMPRLPLRKSGPVVTKASAAPSVMRTGSEESRTGQTTTPTRGAPQKEGAAKAQPLKTSVLDQIASKRAELAEFQRQLDFIAENPANTNASKEKQSAAKKDLRVKQQEGKAALAALVKEQQELVRIGKESKGLRKETKAIAAASEERLREIEKVDPDIETNFRFRTVEGKAPATRMPAEELNRLIASIERSLGGKADITVLDSVTDIAPEQKAGTRAGALINGKLYLFRDGIADGVEGMKTIYHELFHKGLANLMGRNDYVALMNKLYDQSAGVREAAQSWYKKHVDDIDAYRKDFAEKNPDASAAMIDAATRAHIVEEVLAQMAETRKPLGLLQQMRNWFAGIAERFGMSALAKHIRGMEQGPLEQLIDDALRASVRGNVADNRTLFRSTATYANDTLAAAGEIGDKFIAQNQSTYDKIKANGTGLAFETSYVDRFAGFERLAKLMPALKGSQMLYFLRMYDQRMNFVSQSVSRGALQRVEKTRPDGGKEFLIESVDGPSLKGVVETLKEANDMVGSGQGVNRLFTLYLSAIRAKDKGLDALHFGTALTQADLDKAMKAIADTPGLKSVFERARAEYNQYNKGMINFAVQAGAIKKDVAAELLKQNDYIPWYRQRNGVAELVIGKETPIHVGSIANQPYLQELVGGDAPILDFMTSSVQNTNMLTDMSLRNLATKNSVMELVEMKLAKLGHKNLAGPNIVKFRIDGEDVATMIDTDTVGVPADILVKGMEGIPVQLSGLMRILGAPSAFLRRAITLSPVYVARQLFRDSLAAPILSGADFVPVIGALKEINGATKATLESRGITGGQIFTGGSEDLTRILQDITDGKSTWMQGIGKLESLNMEADALTRRAQYNSYIKQGLSEMEATLMSLESMNFNKRGASPSIHLANALIPFFNAQIQSMNVLYKAFRGQLPFNERLKIQEKLLTRGMMVAGISLTYAAAMQDDEAYKNATPDQKYGNWFVRIPGVDEPLKLPIPFEIGYIFKALPEAVYNTMVNEHGGEEAVKAFKTILQSLIPGGSSFGIPQAIKPAIEAKLGKSFFTGRDILRAGEEGLLPEAQFRAETTEASKYIGSALGVSPITLDYLVQGYTGGMGLAFLQAVSMGLPTKGQGGPEQAYKRLSEMPVVGGAFQPNDAGGIITATYERMLEIQKLDSTVDSLINRGMVADAKELLAKRGNEYMMSEMAGEYISTIRELTQYENAVRASDLSPEEKRAKLDEIRQMKIRYSAMMRQSEDKTTLQ